MHYLVIKQSRHSYQCSIWFCNVTREDFKRRKAKSFLVAFDAGKTTFRHEKYSEYKGGRQKTPPELSEQFPYIRQLLDAYHIKRYELDNYEADDIIGTLSKEADKAGFQTIIITGDRDLTQLATDNVTIYYTKKVLLMLIIIHLTLLRKNTTG